MARTTRTRRIQTPDPIFALLDGAGGRHRTHRADVLASTRITRSTWINLRQGIVRWSESMLSDLSPLLGLPPEMLADLLVASGRSVRRDLTRGEGHGPRGCCPCPRTTSQPEAAPERAA